MAEVWKIIEFAPKYEVSNKGRVRNRSTLKIIKPYASKLRPNPRVTLRCGVYDKETHTLSQIVYNHWCLKEGEEMSYYQYNGFMVKGNRIGYRDGNRMNCNPSNLYRY